MANTTIEKHRTQDTTELPNKLPSYRSKINSSRQNVCNIVRSLRRLIHRV